MSSHTTKDIAIYGAGGLGREIACLIKHINTENGHQWNLIGFFDDYVPAGTANAYGSVLGNMEDLNAWDKPLCVVFGISSPALICKLSAQINNNFIDFPNLISPDVLFLDKKHVKMGYGNVICARCLISCNVTLGNFNLLNSNVAVGHDSVIGNYNAIMPSVKISGAVQVGNRNLLGVNSVILQCKTIGDDTIVGASSVIIKNTKNGFTYMGNPAKKITI